MSSSKAELEPATQEMYGVPLTLEGSSVLHQMFRFRWAEWRKLTAAQQEEIATEARIALEKMEHHVSGQSALFSMLGHKAEMMLVHFRKSFDHLKHVELELARLRLSDYLDQTTSYVSVVELGLYDSSVKMYRALREQRVTPHSPEWNAVVEETMSRQKEAMAPRLFPQIPPSRYVCFYPMDKRRGEIKNWYSLPIEERQRQMEDHGLIGRRYAGSVKQIISGSIGFDDWEWGVDLFADDPLVFKRLIYEMRFDEVSADYALFGTFYVGMRCPAARLAELLAGNLPD
jgi:hydrogen peroxide-dependent heme synthase